MSGGSQSRLLLPAEEKSLCLSDDCDGDDSLLLAELDYEGGGDEVPQIAEAGFGSGLINLLKTILGANARHAGSHG